ncbi:MAG: hypothetical protein H7239_13005 [Flavobacterium sp.]|nr:hypothetical protein [Flavobacterium sp.]
MQKIDFVKNLEIIVDKLKSIEITNHFETSFISPTKEYNYNYIIPILFASKSNYDQIKNDGRFSNILNVLNSENIYSEHNLSSLTTILIATYANNILQKSNSISLYNFHKSLITTKNLAKDILQGATLTDEIDNEIDNGVIIFQILIESEGLQTEQYIKIFTSINELIETLNKILEETEEKSEIILLDSGSDANFGIKTGIETAKSLFLIFKEIWDFVVSHKHYKNKQNNQTLIESLTIRTLIQEKINDGIISKEEGLEYTHKIKTRTDDLIGMKVLPKQIVIESNNIENRKLLNEFEGIKLLSADNK